MSSQSEATLPATRRTRKSIGGRSPTRKGADKENATVDIGTTMAANRKKSRSKSMGPAGLDGLKSGTGNRRASLAIPSRPPPRSILKPTIPLLPEIPPHNPKNGANSADNTDNTGTKVALRTEEEQQAAAREREERERAEMEKEITDRREARRKSLANRRVSFAAEATLHTFHEVEEMQDSTTSTNSTRRASSVAAPSPAPQPSDSHGSDASEPPSTPPEAVDEAVAESPANQRDLHQRKNRRSSGAASVYDNDDDTIASTVYDSDVEQAESIAEEMTDSSDDSDDDGTMMTVEAEEMTSASVASLHSEFGADSSGDLDENLRLAAQMAATQRLDDDEEVIAGFAGWGKKNHSAGIAAQRAPQAAPVEEDAVSEAEMTMEMDMDITGAVGGILKPAATATEDEEDGEEEEMDMSMDVTKALGGIISNSKPQTRRKSVRPTQRAAEDVTSIGDQTMDFTMPVGGIKRGRVSDVSHMTTDSNEDMSMEMTTAIGAVLGGNAISSVAKGNRRETIAAEEDEVSLMDMTTAVGRILPADNVEDVDDETIGMDMTMAVGSIIKSVLAPTPEARSAAKKVMEEEVNEPEPSVTASTEIIPSLEKPVADTLPAEPNPEPAAFKGRGPRRSTSRSVSPPKSPVRARSPLKATTPEPSPAAKTRTPTRSKATPVMIGSRSSSPVRQGSPAKTTPGSPSKAKKLFRHDPETGASTPRVVLTPQGRRLSGVGADRPGLGSPKVAQIFDRRESLGDAAGSFTPGKATNARRGVSFADPRVMAAEIDKDREEEEEKENSRRILQREADGEQDGPESTQSLKEMIEGLSPKKNPLRGRKSLHVGSARGLLGKRPAELSDDEAEDMDGVKRLKNLQGSPVKNVKLQSPPSKAETTTGRKTRAGLRSADNTLTENITPTTAPSPKKASSPKALGRFKFVDDQPTNTVDFEHTAALDDIDMQEDDDGERIHLQDFLNMTSIRFMELTTTKRRFTVAPSASRDSSAPDGKEDVSLEKCVVAGACTVPMLELYQHSCRELKKYIAEGRRIVREIETETFEENPPLFREYISATPEFKMLMDNQFKNVKSHARLLSKAMWYEWRMKLQDGLKEGLVNIAEGMDHDDKVLKKQQELLSSVLPEMTDRVQSLEREHEDLEAVARELAESDPEELQKAREQLVATDKAIAERMKQIAELRAEVEESEKTAASLAKRKQECLDEIKEADKVREECRGWSPSEISAIKTRVDALEKKHGWAITGISGTTLSMSYKREIELVFDAVAFAQAAQRKQNTSIDIWYIAANREFNAVPSTPEREFFLQCIRDRVRALPQATTSVQQLVREVSSGWDKANSVAKQARFLNITFPTTVAKTSDSSVCVTSSLLLAPLKTRVEVKIHLYSSVGPEGLEVTATPEAKVVYGEPFNTVKMGEFLAGRLGGRVTGDAGKTVWSDAMLELRDKLMAKGQAVAQK